MYNKQKTALMIISAVFIIYKLFYNNHKNKEKNSCNYKYKMLKYPRIDISGSFDFFQIYD